jgi:hypothetical protein
VTHGLGLDDEELQEPGHRKFQRLSLRTWSLIVVGLTAAALVLYDWTSTRNTVSPEKLPISSASLDPRITTVYVEQGFQVINDGAHGSYTMTIGNDGPRPVTLWSPEAKSLPPGIMLLRNTKTVTGMADLLPGETTPLTIAFRVIDCAKLPKAEWSLRLKARTQLEGGSSQAGYIEVQPPGKGTQPWQLTATADYCHSSG